MNDSQIPPPLTPSSGAPWPPAGWREHPAAAGQYYCGNEVLYEEDLRARYQMQAEPPTEEVDAAELQQMIAERTGVAPEMPKTAEFAMDTGPEPAEPAEPDPEIPLPPQWSDELAESTQRQSINWSTDTEDLGHVIVTDTEQRTFVKQAAHNREVEFHISLGKAPDEILLKIRSLSNKSLDALLTALQEDRKAGLFGIGEEFDPGFFATRMQIMSMLMQVREIDRMPLEWSPEFDELDTLSKADLAAKLRTAADRWGPTLSAPRHALIVFAVRVFERKFQLCKHFLRSDFSSPAG